MKTTEDRPDVRDATSPGHTPVRVTLPDDVREVIRERGGSLFVWPHVHGVCEGKMTFLDVATERPEGVSPPFQRLEAGDVAIFFSIGSLLWPESLDLELHGRKKQIRAYWNGQASVW
jgi:hypothetical protein